MTTPSRRPHRSPATRRIATLWTALLTALTLGMSPAAWAQGTSSPPSGLGPDGTSTVHGDTWSTDSQPGRGPGPGPAVTGHPTAATCSSVFVSSEGMPVALCTAYLGTDPVEPVAPTVRLFDPVSGAQLASVQLAKASLLGGVYGYLDDRDRVVVADGNRNLLAVGHERVEGGDGASVEGAGGGWRMTVEVLASLEGAVPEGDSVGGLAPAFDDRIWFVTAGGVVGTVRPGADGAAREVRTLRLGEGERMTNGVTTRAGGASVITTRALYEIDAPAGGELSVRWRKGYDVAPARRPGLLANGSGTTPTYFDAGTGGAPDEFVAYTDDGTPAQLIVARRSDGSEVCRMPAFATTLDPSTAADDGVLIDGPAYTENSIVTRGNAMVLVNTYGFHYMPMAVEGPAVPATDVYRGGMTRVDVDPERGCERVWTNRSRSASLPRLTRDDGLIHTMAYGPVAESLSPGSAAADGLAAAHDAGWGQKAGPVFATATDLETGAEAWREPVGHGPVDEPMELTGVIAPGVDGAPGVWWQPTMGRMLRIG